MSRYEEVKERLCLALDLPTFAEAESAVDRLRDYVGVFKLGMELYTAEGPRVVEMIHNKGGKVFLDLKFHDIPTTVAKAAAVATRLGVLMFNVHGAGGSSMMRRCVDAVNETADKEGLGRPITLAVTVLTSMNQDELTSEIGVGRDLKDQIVHLAQLAQNAGLDGVVASPKEIVPIRDACGRHFILVTPGVRPAWAEANDQKRVATPKEAMAKGADYIVVGRPILAAEKPDLAARMVLDEMLEVA